MRENKTNDKTKAFEKAIIRRVMGPNILAGILTVVYIFYFSGLPYDVLGPEGIIKLSLIFTISFFTLAFIIAPVTNRIITRNTGKMLQQETAEDFTPAQRTLLVKKLMIMPLYIAIEAGVLFITGIIIIGIYTVVFLPIPVETIVLLSGGIFYGTCIAAIISYIAAESITSKNAKELLQKPVDIGKIHKDKFYGLSLNWRVFFHVVLPFIASCSIEILFFWKNISANIKRRIFLPQLMHMVILNGGICAIIAYFFYRHISQTTKNSASMLEKISAGKSSENDSIPTDLGFELEYSIFLINEVIHHLKDIAHVFSTSSKSIKDGTDKLLTTAEQNALTAKNELEKVNESARAMDNIKNIVLTAGESTNTVKNSSEQTKDSIQESRELLRDEIMKMGEVTEVNIKAIEGIQSLSEKLNDIWKLIRKIDLIAERNKMIAFNAELKASASQGAGATKFHIIANELRRLVSTITTSSNEIKRNIKVVQEGADNLAITSEVGTQKIREGSEFFSQLDDSFNSLETSSTITAESAVAIQETLKQQSETFFQVNTSLYQMKVGFEQFTVSADSIKSASENLHLIANKLNDINGFQLGDEQ